VRISECLEVFLSGVIGELDIRINERKNIEFDSKKE
jgi:hypothetical protein